MNGVFADTSFYVALFSKRDRFHSLAEELSRKLTGAVWTTEYVLIEAANWFAAARQRPLLAQMLVQLDADPQTALVGSSSSLFKEGVDLYSRRLDKEWSLTDCISFVVMQHEGLRQALSTDHHFEQAGFEILLK